MDRIEWLRIFQRVVELSSFTQAAERMGLPKARVSLAIQELEKLVGTRLLERTTRRVSPTLDGLAFYQRSRDLVAEFDDLQSMFRTGGELRGRIRVDMPLRLAKRLIIPQIPQFLALHPQIELELSTTDRLVDPIREGIDCVVRIGSREEPGMLMKPLGEFSVINCASPEYLARRGQPLHLSDLHNHHLVYYSSVPGSQPSGFEYFDGRQFATLPMQGCVTVDNSEGYLAACLAGLGIIQIPETGVGTHLASGRLVQVLPHLVPEPMPLSLLYPHRKLSRPLIAFLEWLESIFKSKN